MRVNSGKLNIAKVLRLDQQRASLTEKINSKLGENNYLVLN